MQYSTKRFRKHSYYIAHVPLVRTSIGDLFCLAIMEVIWRKATELKRGLEEIFNSTLGHVSWGGMGERDRGRTAY